MNGNQGRPAPRAGTPRPPSPGSVWVEHGRRLRRLCQRELGDAAAADVACQETLLRAARLLSAGRGPTETGVWLWLRSVALAVCDEVREASSEAVSRRHVPPGPRALPPRIQAHFTIRDEARRQETALERDVERGALGALGALVYRAQRALREERDHRWRHGALVFLTSRLNALAERVSRERHQRSPLSVTHADVVQLPTRLAGLLSATPAVTEAVAVAAFAVVLGISGPSTAPGPVPQDSSGLVASAQLARSDGPRFARVDSRSATVPREAAGLEAHATPDAPTAPHAPAAPHAPTAPDAPAATPPAPRLSAESGASVEEPVQETPYERGTHYETPAPRMDGDVTGDGEDDIAVAPPVVFVDCPEPDQRGAATAVACTVLDEPDASTGEGVPAP